MDWFCAFEAFYREDIFFVMWSAKKRFRWKVAKPWEILDGDCHIREFPFLFEFQVSKVSAGLQDFSSSVKHWFQACCTGEPKIHKYFKTKYLPSLKIFVHHKRKYLSNRGSMFAKLIKFTSRKLESLLTSSHNLVCKISYLPGNFQEEFNSPMQNFCPVLI